MGNIYSVHECEQELTNQPIKKQKRITAMSLQYDAEKEFKQNNLNKASDLFIQASRAYDKENKPVCARQCRLQTANILINISGYGYEVAKIYFDIGNQLVDDPLEKYIVRRYYFKSLLSVISTSNLQEAKIILVDCDANLRKFNCSVEYKFIDTLINCIENRLDYNDIIEKYDEIYNFDKCELILIDRIRTTF